MGTGSQRTFLRLIPAPVFALMLAPDGKNSFRFYLKPFLILLMVLLPMRTAAAKVSNFMRLYSLVLFDVFGYHFCCFHNLKLFLDGVKIFLFLIETKFPVAKQIV